MFKLIPQNTRFYDYFDRIADILVRATEHFHKYLENYANPGQNADQIKQLEHQCDELTHETMELLHRTFITPLERGDIRRLTERLDDVLDFLDDAARRFVLYEIKEVLPDVKRLAKVLVEAAKTVQMAVHELRMLRKKNGILMHCIEVRRLENEGDHINHELLAHLFKSDLDPYMVLKWKEIIVDIETAIDRCQDVANVIEGIVLENS